MLNNTICFAVLINDILLREDPFISYKPVAINTYIINKCTHLIFAVANFGGLCQVSISSGISLRGF